MKKLIPYGRQSISKDDISSVIKALRSDFLTTGPLTKKFETKFSNYVGSKYAISCSSGTSALHLALMSLNIKTEDIVILPVINFIASINMSYFIGAKIYFADVDKLTGQMTPETLEHCIKTNKIKKIKAVITMYNGGNPNHAKSFFKLKKKYKFFLIEDACHALGGKYDIAQNFKVGSCKYSDLATFSLHPIKSITTGEGGVVTTNNLNICKKINVLKNHGMKKKFKKNYYNWKYNIVKPGFNYRLNDISCALGISQLKKLKKFIKIRSNIYDYYLKELSKYKNLITLPKKVKNQLSANHLFVIILNRKKIKLSRDRIIQKLYMNNILTQVHYIPVFKHPFYKNLSRENFIGANYYYSNCLSLPIFPSLKLRDLKKIIKILISIIKKNVNEKNH